MSPKPDHDPGIEHEPHLRGTHTPPGHDPSEGKAGHTLEREARRGGSDRLAAINSVIEEPFALQKNDSPTPPGPGVYCARCGYDLRGQPDAACPECGFDPSTGYAAYLKERIDATPAGMQWAVMLLAIFCGGALSILGTFIGQAMLGSDSGLVALAVSGPIYEELMKVMLVLMLIELKPYLFKSSVGIWVATLSSAATFAVIENLLYLLVYIPDAGPAIALWRWSVCSALHISCTAITTLGLVRMWRKSIISLRPPLISHAMPYMIVAIVLHGVYNAFAVLMHFTGLLF